MVNPADSENGWERFRGEVLARLDTLRDGQEDIGRAVETYRVESRVGREALHNRVDHLWMWIAGIGITTALTILIGAIDWLVRKH